MNNCNRIDMKDISAAVRIPDIFLRGCSNNSIMFTADGGNHFTDYGIYEGMFLLFDLDINLNQTKENLLVENFTQKENAIRSAI